MLKHREKGKNTLLVELGTGLTVQQAQMAWLHSSHCAVITEMNTHYRKDWERRMQLISGKLHTLVRNVIRRLEDLPGFPRQC